MDTKQTIQQLDRPVNTDIVIDMITSWAAVGLTVYLILELHPHHVIGAQVCLSCRLDL